MVTSTPHKHAVNMKKGTKRKASQRDSRKEDSEAAAARENNGAPSEAGAAAASAAVAEEEPTRKRCARGARIPNLEDLWKEVFPVGTEWDQLDLVYKYNWSFRNLEEAFEEGGKLYGKKVYLFGCTEAQLVFFEGQGKVTMIPVVVAVDSPMPPSEKIGIASVQREREDIVPMKQMKMDWVPYIPLEKRESQVERLKSQIFILSCTQRRAGLRHLKIERVKDFEYCLPYLFNPLKQEEPKQTTVVDIMFPVEPPVLCDFDWDMDELEEFTDNLIEEEVLAADQKDAFKDFVKERVREEKKKNREAREARKKELEEMGGEETKAAFQNMRFYKFYPVQTPDTPDISNLKATYINRYYGHAHEVL